MPALLSFAVAGPVIQAKNDMTPKQAAKAVADNEISAFR